METLMKELKPKTFEDSEFGKRLNNINIRTLSHFGLSRIQSTEQIRNCPIEESCRNKRASIQTLMEEIEVVISEMDELEYRDVSILETVSANQVTASNVTKKLLIFEND